MQIGEGGGKGCPPPSPGRKKMDIRQPSKHATLRPRCVNVVSSLRYFQRGINVVSTLRYFQRGINVVTTLLQSYGQIIFFSR